MYITKEDIQSYNAKFDATDADIAELIRNAESDVNSLTFHRIPAKGGLEQFSEFIQRQVKAACCEQVIFMQAYGGMINSPFQSYGINGVSMSFKEDAVVNRGGVTVSRQVYNLLLPTGLMNRSIR